MKYLRTLVKQSRHAQYNVTLYTVFGFQHLKPLENNIDIT